MLEFLEGGFQTTVQDYPGRVGYWWVGIPPSGPMDPLAFRLANMLVDNPSGEAGLEITAAGPKIRFQEDNVIAITGANFQPKIDDEPIPMWESVRVKKDQILSFGLMQKHGFRTYLSVAGGINVPPYLGSKSTLFIYGKIGGFEGRSLKGGDVLKTGEPNKPLSELKGRKVKTRAKPTYKKVWEVGAIPGPHADPDFFITEDMELFFSYKWKVSLASNRVGIRLQGPNFRWARKDGGEGGKHPSNVLDYAYAIGTVNVTGEMPIILTVDGPSLGGFVSNATVASAELWKVGQAYPGRDEVKFKKLTVKDAIKLRRKQEKLVQTSIIG